MSDVLEGPALTDADYKAEAEQISRDIEALFREMDEARRVADQLKSETAEIKARTEPKLEELDRLVRSLSRPE